MKKHKLDVYMEIVETISKLSPDQQTKVGALLLSKYDKIVATGYNGFVRGANDNILPKTRPDKYEYIIHAETNMLLNCLEDGINTRDATIICSLSPCLSCLRQCYQAGIKKIIFKKSYLDKKTYCNLKDIDLSYKKLYNYYCIEFKRKKRGN